MNDLKNNVFDHTFTQFAENQISKEQSFLKILGFLGAVIFGYAFVYKKFTEGVFSFAQLGIVNLASILLLTGGAWLIVAIGYTFRRDQFINAKIKKKTSTIGEDKLFPLNYNPLSIYCLKKNFDFFNVFMEREVKKKLNDNDIDYINMIYLRWIPDIFFIYYFLFPVFTIFMNIILTYEYIVNGDSEAIFFTLIMTLCILLTLIILFIPIKYSRKLMRRLLVWSGLISFGSLSGFSGEKKDIIKRALEEL